MGFLKKHSELIYFIALLIIAAGMPLGNFFMSLGGIILVVSWLFHGNLWYKIQLAFSNRIILGMAAFYALHLIGMFYSDDMQYALNDARIKIPLLLYPMIIYAMPRPEEKKINILLAVFVIGVLISTFISFFVYLGVIPPKKDIADIRNISLFISHIRLSLLVCVAISLLVYFSVKRKNLRVPVVFLILWFVYFLYLLISATGFVILSALLLFLLLVLALKKGNIYLRLGYFALAVVLVVVPSRHIHQRFILFFTPTEDISNLDITTENGEPYIHEIKNLVIENGKFINIYIAPRELEEAWMKRSSWPYASWDKQKHPLRHTIVRYMTSKGLRKDKKGVEALTEEDIKNIENGIPNYHYTVSNNINKRLDQFFFELEIYFKGLSPVGGSIVQRLEFWKNGWMIFKENKWVGVGTGDVQMAFNNMYERNESLLDNEHRLRSHNQFLSVMVAFGLVGLTLFLTALILPLLKAIRKKNLLYIAFFIVAFMSFLTEDTLETQAGVTFFSFLNAVLLFFIPGKANGEQQINQP
ncbi:MAG: O-antigen ligase family protein [Bacteroidota bacterium]